MTVPVARPGITWKRFEHPAAFWLGTLACIAGVILHLPMYYSTRGMHYQMAGMRPDGAMIIGMALIALCGIGGTVIGSWACGLLAGRIGRRSSIIFAGLLFVTTSICGAMPGFTWNMVMCFLMGIGAGGMLPVTFALLAETIPARHRGWLLVLIGGCVADLGYVLTSWLAGALTPQYSWRILWLIGLPTGAVFIALSRWIPESPRFLIATGQRAEAERIMSHFGAAIIDDAAVPAPAGERGDPRLFGSPFTGRSVAIMALAVGTGLVAYGFQLWIPANLQHLGFTSVNSGYIVRNAALLGLPLSVVLTACYGLWSSKQTILIAAGALALSLAGLAAAGNSVARDHALLTALLVIPLTGTALIAALTVVYAAEIFPTSVRSRGTGLAAAATKAGGLAIIAMAVAAATTPSIATTALAGVIPLALGAIIFMQAGVETRSRGLEEISQAPARTTDVPVA